MNRIDTGMSSYLHSYEAYRIPKGTTVKDATGEEVVLNKEEDSLVLTKEASKQLVEDRRDYVATLQLNAQMAAQKTQDAASEKYWDDQAKAMAVFRSMANGDIVPYTDEKKLMEYSDELYQAAKQAQTMAQILKERVEKKESEWDEEEEAEFREKMEMLKAESNEAAQAIGTGSQAFSEAQKSRIVEVDSSDVDFSQMQTMNLGSGVTGMNIDLSL